MSVWDALVGQAEVVAPLTEAARAAAQAGPVAGTAAGAGAGTAAGSAEARDGMTNSWLFTGPPGSGRSVAARAFAAALSCAHGTGCGDCPGCHTVLTDTATDLRTVRPEGLSLGIAQVRALVRDAARAPTAGRWRILLIEDADRLTEAAANAALKALEEPAERTVFLLCAPSADDVLPTIRSRCRVVRLRLPALDDVAAVLEREGVEPALAHVAARAAQGHVGRARRLATDEQARARRGQVLRIPARLRRVGDCLAAAAELVDAAGADAEAANAERDAAETEALKSALGVGATAVGGRSKSARAPKPGAKGRAMQVRGAAGAVKELEKAQKSRGRRTVLDSLDRALADLAGLYRDVLVRQLRASVEPIHPDHAVDVDRLAASATPEQTLHRLEAVLATRASLADNPGLAPLLTVESLTLALRTG
jgi:DNA polymerase-3 subunit delta'